MREASDHLFRTLIRLVPDSGVQFLDFTIPRSVADGLVRQYREERLQFGAETVWALAPLKVTGAMDDRSRPILSVTGRHAINAVLDQWIPVPYLRFVSRDGDGRARFDQGPFNWTRLYIASPTTGDDPASYRAVVAFDTRTDPSSRVDVETYVMPTFDDVRFSSTFAVTDDAEALAHFLAEDWIQEWLRSTFPLLQQPAPNGAPGTYGLQQVATYLTLLAVLCRAGVLPSLQFYDTRGEAVAPAAVDLVLDLGTARSCAMLVESADGRPQLSRASLLALRDLGRPTCRYRGVFESRIAFARPTFGSDALSRKSGRADAFHWPSLARTGSEAVRIAAASMISDGAVGIASPKAHLRDQTAREDTWRFAPDPRQRVRRSPMIAGRLLSLATPVAGLLTGPNASIRPITQRPRYALSAMTSFQIAEVALQALSTINAPVMAGTDQRDEAVRHLRQIIVTAPLTMPREDRDLLRERADMAIDMLWHALDWNDTPHAPAKPVVRLGLDETLAAQLVYLFDCIGHRFGGDARACLDILGRSRPDFGVQPCLRFGAIDCGSGHTTMTIVTYASNAAAPIQPKLLGAQRSQIAGGAILDQIVHALLLPELAAAVARAGGEAPHAFLADLLTDAATTRAHDPLVIGTRLTDLWLRPAAVALLGLATGLSADGGQQMIRLTLADLAGAAGPTAHAVSAELSVALEAIRSAPIDLATVPVTLRMNDIDTVVRSALQPMVESLSRALVASDCDIVVLTGWVARHPALRSLLLEHLPWRPDRIVSLSDYPWQDWYPMDAVDRAAADGKDVSLVGALLALAGGVGFGFNGNESEFSFGGSGLGGADGGWRDAEAASP